MPLAIHPSHSVLRRDKRYAPQAYDFLRDALEYAVDVLDMGEVKPTAPLRDDARTAAAALKAELKRRRIELPDDHDAETGDHRHLSGRELCEAIRLMALERFGYMARCVFHCWGMRATDDFGKMVYHLIRLGRMRTTDDDRPEDFQNIFDFDADLREAFEFTLADLGP